MTPATTGNATRICVKIDDFIKEKTEEHARAIAPMVGDRLIHRSSRCSIDWWSDRWTNWMIPRSSYHGRKIIFLSINDTKFKFQKSNVNSNSMCENVEEICWIGWILCTRGSCNGRLDKMCRIINLSNGLKAHPHGGRFERLLIDGSISIHI